MSDGGFIKLSRKLINWRWYRNLVTKSVFIHILLTANYSESELEGIKIHRGQLVTSYPSLAEKLGITIQQARTAIEHLKSTGEITAKRYPKFQVISIVNYDSYQSISTGKTTGNQQSNNSQDTSQITVSKESKENSTTYYEEEKERARAKRPPDGDTDDDDEPPAIKPWEYAGFATAEEYDAYLEEKWSK